MKFQQLYSKTRQALDDFHMIVENDNIAVGISGGKDSLALLYALNGLRRFYPLSFELHAITVDLGFKNQNFGQIQSLCNDMGIPFHLVTSRIGEIVFQIRKEDNPCSLCAKLRKGALNEMALSLGCNKIAYGHHLDDIVDTMMLSLIYEGRFHTMQPVTYLDKTKLTVIRPLIYLHEAEIKGLINKNKIMVLKNQCPVDGLTKRQSIKDLISQINSEAPGVKDRMFTAVLNSQLEGWKKVK